MKDPNATQVQMAMGINAGLVNNAPGSTPGCPPGLEYLVQLDELIMEQKVETFEGRKFPRIFNENLLG